VGHESWVKLSKIVVAEIEKLSCKLDAGCLGVSRILFRIGGR
jgi:hypothetical protein